MSIALMTAAFKTKLSSTVKFVLVALCDNANDQGECFPSVSMLCSKTSLSDRAVQKSISFLIDGKYLSRDLRNGRSTYYFIADPRTWFTPELSSPPNHVHPTPELSSPPPPNVVHPTPEPRSPITIKEPSVEPSGNHKKKAKSDLFDLPDWVPVGSWNGFLEMRKAKRKEPTSHARDLLIKSLAEILAAGHDLAGVLDKSTINGWTDVYMPKTNAQSARYGSETVDQINARVTAEFLGMSADDKNTIEMEQ